MNFMQIRPVPDKNKMNAVIYARYSSDKQTENSVDGQLHSCYQFCENKGFSVIGEYIDRALSGTTDNRPEFLRMIEDSKKQEFAYIIVYRFDRFARNRFDSAIYKKGLQQVGVRVISACENVGDGDEGIILESIYEAMDEAYSRRLSTITKRGMRESAVKGQWTGGNIPLGYQVRDKHLVIDEKEAVSVKLIFEMYADGKTKQQIANELNERGLCTKKGNTFTCSNFTSILKNKMYYGDYSFDDIKRTCPAIISRELFEKVQQLQLDNKRCFGRKVSDTFFELGGKAYCGNCGAALIGDSGTSRTGERYYYYTCGKKKKHRSCKKTSEKKDFLEWYVCEQTVNYLLTPDRIRFISEKVVECSKQDSAKKEIAELEKNRSVIEKEISASVNALVKTSVESAIAKINENLESLDKQLHAVNADINALRLKTDIKITVAQVEKYLNSFCNGDLFDETYRHKIINTLVNCVYIFDDKIVIYYNLRNTKQVCYIDALSDADLPTDKECSDSLHQGEPKNSLRLAQGVF